MIVDKNIEADEECIRCVIHPLMFAKNKLKRECVLPPRNSNKVSLLRLKYAEQGADFCVQHGLSLNRNNFEFCGLASIKPCLLNECNALSKKQSPNNSISAQIVYAPMSQGAYVDTSIDVDTEDPNIDLPMHADLTYNIVDGNEVRTAMRMYANELLKKIRFAFYENGQLGDWKDIRG